MKARTFMSTDWIEVHNHGSIYLAKICLTDEDEAYMQTIQSGKKRFYKVNVKLLRLGELGFFENVLEEAIEITEKEIPIVI